MHNDSHDLVESDHTHTAGTHCSIVPPYILDALANSPDPAVAAEAQASLATDAAIRAARSAPQPQVAPSAAGARPTKERRVFDTKNTTSLPGTLVRSEGGPATGDAATDEAYDGVGATFDLFWNVFARDSIDDAGMGLDSSVHVGSGWGNAMWNGTQMLFGDGDKYFGRMTKSIDVMGHELTHGVTQKTAGLAYRDQSGALNESVSDVFGSMVKQRAANPPQTAATADWIIGAGLFKPGINGVGLRSMKAPGTAFNDPVIGKDPQPAHMKDFIVMTDDDGGVHYNSGIPNRAFYLVAIGLGGYSWDRAGKVWYAVLRDARLTKNANFVQFATITVDVAKSLYGQAAADVVLDAWVQVGVLTAPVRHGWKQHELSSAATAPFNAAGDPTSTYDAVHDTQHVYYRTADNHIRELYCVKSGGWAQNDLMTAAKVPALAIGDPTSTYDAVHNVQHVYYCTSDNHIRELYWRANGGWAATDVTAAAKAPAVGSSNPCSTYDAVHDAQHIYYATGDGHIRELYWTAASGWAQNDLTVAAKALANAIGDPTSTYDAVHNTQHVYYCTSDNHIHELYWTPAGGWAQNDLTVAAKAPANAVGDPTCTYDEVHNTQHVYYRSADNHMRELYWTPAGGWQQNDPSTAGQAPILGSSNPCSTYDAVHDIQHIYYRTDDSRIRELYWS